jgi:cytochrome P450
VQAEVDGEKLTDAEIVSFFGLLIVAGNDTTRQSTSHGMKALTDFPDQRAWLRRTSTAACRRRRGDRALGHADHDLPADGGARLRARRPDHHRGRQGDHVLRLGQLGHRGVHHPERFDLSRSPNPHVSFGGGGIHHCLGNQLARRQLAAVFRQLLSRLPDIEVVGEPTYGNGNFFHAVNSMTVRFTPEA